MQQLIPVLFAHERRALCAALYRDQCRELQRATTDREWADWHEQNARLSKRLLVLIEALGEPD